MRRFRLFSMLAVLLCAASMWAAPAEAANGKLPDALLASEYANCYNCWRDVYPKAGNECKLWSFLNNDEEDTGSPWKIEDAGLFNPDDDAYNAIWVIVEVMFQQNNISGDAKSEYISNYEDYLDLGEKPILSAKGKELASQVRLHRLYQKQGDTWVPKQLGEQESYGYVIVVGYKSSDKYIALCPTGQDNGFHLLTNMSATEAASYPERESALNITFAGDAFTPESGGDTTPSDSGKLPEGVDGLVYTGAAQTLVTEGEKDGFTFYYKVGESGEWSTALPAAIAAGTYTVYYKATAEGEEDITGSLDVTIAKADIQLPGAGTVFSTSADSYIQFAPGNLQYQASTDTWRFAEHAWDYIGNVPGNNVYTGRESQSDWIDLFSWATGKNPTYISEDSKDFQPSITEGEFAVSDDWGTAAASYIGEGWRTITYAEWMYLWESRANAANLHAKAQVNGVNGYLLLPDGWTSAGVRVNITGDRGAFSANTLTLEQWETLASQGATFLPAAGFNQYSTEPYYEGQPASEYQYVNQAGTFGYYWMSTAATDGRANVFMFYDSSTYPYTWRDRSMIISVRPVQDAEKPKSETTLPKAIGGLITNGEAQTLITAGSSKEGTFLYSLDGENWSETLPTGVEAKDYTVYYKIKGDNNHNDSPVGQLTASIGTLPKAIDGLTYTGKSLTLVEGGEIAGYTYQYKVGEDGEWSTALPAEIPAGTYTVYYKATAEGEENITGSVYVTIAKADIDLNGGGNAGAIGGFSISESTKVGFAPGNLQYQASSGTWRFAEHQWDTIGNAAGNTTEEADRATQADWIDLFGWGTGLNPTYSEYKEGEYATFNDWGAQLPASLGTWRTPTGDEWDYLFNTRANAVNLRGKASVNGVNGLIILPDAWVAPAGVTFNANVDGEGFADINSYTAAQWAVMEAAGAVFLPAGGDRWFNNVYAVGEYGYYWSASIGEYTPHHVTFSQWNESFMPKYEYNSHHCGMSVRLIGGAASASLTLPKAIERLVYTGAQQALIEAGESSEGTFLYSIDGENWADTLPKGLDAGDYTVYYKVQGDANHNDSEVGGPIEVTIAKAESEYTEPEAIELTYNGKPQMPVVPGTSEDGKFQYSPDGENWTDTVPKLKDAGEYSIYYRFVGDENHEDGEPESVIVTIAKAAPEFTAPVANEPTYNEQPQALVAAGTTEDGYFEYSLDGENWSTEIPTATDAGEYTIYYRVIGDDNHLNVEDEEFAVTVTIAKAAPKFTAPVANEPTYNGEPQALVAAGTTEDGTMLYSMDGENWSTEIPTATDAGEYTVYYRVIGDDNHLNAEDEEYAVAVTIAKAAPEFTAPVANEPTYNEQPQALIAAGTTEDGTMLYSMDGENWSTEIPTATNAGEYTVYYKVQGDDNRKDSEPETVIVTIAKAAPEFTAPEANEPTYNEQPQALIAAGATEDGTMLYSLDGENWSETIPTATNAGEYTVYYKVQGDANHLNAEDEEYAVAVTIAKAAPEFTAPVANEPTYNEQPQALIAAGTTEDGTMLYSMDGENWSEIIPTATNAGEYTVYYKVQGDANHLNAEDEEYAVTVTIAKAAPEFTAPVANEPTYNEQPQALIAAGTTEDGTMLYSMDGENWSEIIPTATNAGEYTVYYKVQGDANHNDSDPESVTVTIAKAAPEFTAPVANEPTYNEQPQALIAAGTTEDGTMLYSLDGENWSTEIPTATNAGDYTVYYKVQGDDNHSDSEAESVIVTIAKAEAEFTAPEANEPTYNGEPQALISAGTTEDGTMLYSLDGENWSTEIPAVTNAGEYTVYYKVLGDANHNDSEPESMTVTIAKATLSVSEVEVVKAKFADGNANAQVTIHGVLNGVQGDDAITLTTTAAYDNAEVGDGKTITVSYTLTADAAVLANYEFPVTTEVYTTEGVIIEPMVPNNDATPETTDQEVKEGIEVNAYGFCHGENYSLGYHLKSGDPNQYKIEFPDSRFTDVDWTDLVINGASGRDGYIDINVPVDLPTGMYSMTVTFRRYIAFSDGSSISLESAPFTTSFNVNLPETYTMPLFDNVIALVDTCECLTDVQWYHREKSTDEWQLIPGATDYYYKQEGGLTGEYFAKVKMNGVETFTCPQTDVETLYGQGDAAAKQAKVSVYPNPVVSTATVTIEDSDTFDHILRVVNGNGWQVEQREFEGMETTINLTGCTAGHYMISVDGVVVKVIKK